MFERGGVTSIADLRPLLGVDEESHPSPRPTVLRADWGSVLDGSLVKAVRLYSAVVAAMTPQERFEHQTGVSATVEHGFVEPIVSEEAAASAQQRLFAADRVQRVAEASRTTALLAAYTASMADLEVRFGKPFGLRTGLGAQAFFRSIGLSMQLHPFRVAHLVDTGMTARDHLPKTWQQFLTGRTTWQAVDLAVGQADGLDPDRWPAYDAEASTLVVSSTRLKDALRKVRERLQDDTAPARARTTFQRRTTRLEPGADGSATWSMTGPAADQVAFDQALTRAAVLEHGRDGETRSVGQLKYDIARDLLIGGIHTAATATRALDGSGPQLAVPERQGVQVTLVLTIPALAWLGRTAEQAQLAGCGPISLDTARELAGDATSMLRVLTDPITGVRLTMDRTVYAPPPDLKRWITVRDQHCRFPGCRRPAHRCDIDHPDEWHDGGLTAADNLISLSRDHHNPKTSGLYREHLEPDGTVEWTDVWGNVFTDPPADPLDPAPASLLPDHDARCPF